MSDYEIRYLKPGGKVSFLFRAMCADDHDASHLALEMFDDEYAAYEVWREDSCVEKGRHLSPDVRSGTAA